MHPYGGDRIISKNKTKKSNTDYFINIVSAILIVGFLVVLVVVVVVGVTVLVLLLLCAVVAVLSTNTSRG
jgi:1,4-dihydroxy-2-naphthoate octaprenyltransferase